MSGANEISYSWGVSLDAPGYMQPNLLATTHMHSMRLIFKFYIFLVNNKIIALLIIKFSVRPPRVACNKLIALANLMRLFVAARARHC